ncbi:DUF979 domain-containing protein [Pseudomarimonas salicorniae]|uniref:DUF979 domain-containing protein n=1 Tax=Pseudomarimonas salicorniae TaxID=2933270 RepID=A0ABT0GK02_9GAMM|nr:DUF979 domain-containing protein [Lysobacter sp. CAU 1642]MCK7594871.1 DUF979 domain-containing protein [Lysobacter sp. CAU 1642]
MIDLQLIYWLSGAYFAWLALAAIHDRSHSRPKANALFWGVLALLFLAGERLPNAVVGLLVVVLALIAGFGGLGQGTPARRDRDPAEEARRHGHRLFLPALIVPLFTVLVAVLLKDVEIAGQRLFGAQQTTLVGLGLACLIAIGAACLLVRQSPVVALAESRRLCDAIGWAALLPLLLATLGSVFTATGVGEAVAGVATAVVPADNRFALVLAYALGMALFTMIMGNAFAAFPVMTAGIGLPLLVQGQGADAASLAAIGMLSGYCGTLMTPMAANFNLIPAALLELKDPYGVIRMQIGTAIPLLACNIVLMYLIVFR